MLPRNFGRVALTIILLKSPMCAAAVTSGRTFQGAGIDRYSTASSSEIGAVEPGAAAGTGGGGRE